MATEKQVEANRRNAARSTGPKTDEGKASSSQNATKHGMTSKFVLPEELESKQSERYSAWVPSFSPRDEYQEFQLHQVVRASLRVEHCQKHEIERKIELAQIARDPGPDWDHARDTDAARLGKTLKRDPEYVMLQLRETPAGRDWLIAQWNHLLNAASQESESKWSDVESNRALDLLGKPKTLRETMIARLYNFNHPQATRALILKAIADLEAQQVHADAQNTRLREVDIYGFNLDGDANLKLIRRYETASQLQFDKFLQLFRTHQKGTNSQPKPQPVEPEAFCETNPIPTAASEPSYETNPIPTAAPEPSCETNPIPTRPEPEPRVRPSEFRVDPPTQSPPAPHGNRLHRKKLQAKDRHDAYLARKKA